MQVIAATFDTPPPMVPTHRRWSPRRTCGGASARVGGRPSHARYFLGARRLVGEEMAAAEAEEAEGAGAAGGATALEKEVEVARRALEARLEAS